jgi:hypothetical protein
MDYDDAVKSLKDIRTTMSRTGAQVSRDPGWFFLIQGSIWLIGFLVTQFAPSIAGPSWIALNIVGISAVIVTSIILYGRKGRQRHPGMASRIVAITVGILVFDGLLVFSFGLTGPQDFSYLLVISMAFCYFVIGLTTRQSMSVMGAFIALAVFGAKMLFPSYLYLSIGILGGGSFIASGLFILLRKGKSDA